MRKIQSCVSLLMLFMVACSQPSAQAQPANKAPLKVIQADSVAELDFQLQGEYMGYVATRAGSAIVKKWGVQVIARGPEAFDVVTFVGGLPGDGWNQEDRQRFPAQLTDDSLHVVTEQMQLRIARNTVQVTDYDGHDLGQLSKYARRSATLGKAAPANAQILFAGLHNDLWKNMKVTNDGLLQEGCETVEVYADFHLHIEFRLPYKPEGVGQDRGNSGVYLQRRYELQVLDSFGEPEEPNLCGGIYKLHAPEQNMCLPPLSWQTYDIDFRMARFDEAGHKTENMKIRVKHNGIIIHDGIEVESKTGAGKQEGPEKLSILLQDHGNPVRYRNIWMVTGDPFATKTQSANIPAEAVSRLPSLAAPGYFPEYRTPYHNYGLPGSYPYAYWYSPTFVDLPAYPYYGFGR